MQIILLSGGSGKRLWPLSNEIRSKQFLKILKYDNGVESMVQRMYRMMKSIDSNVKITIATSENQIPQIREQLGENVNICVEPCRKDTFPAIALACLNLYKAGTSRDEAIVVCPVDPYADLGFYKTIISLNDSVLENKNNICLVGIKPTYPSEKYGYIEIENNKVCSFKEKPNEDLARKLIAKGALWNSGVFAFKLGYLLDIIKKEIKTNDYDKLLNNYEKLNAISFDYAVVEKEQSIGFVEYEGMWKDLGTWNTLTEAMTDYYSGNVVASDCNNTHVINELAIPLVALGIDNAVIAATSDGILVSDKESSSSLKDYVVSRRPMFEKREWGEYRVLDYVIQNNERNSLTKHLIIKSGKHISYQIHKHRKEIWTIIQGQGRVILNNKILKLEMGDSIVIDEEVKHGIIADTELHIIEVQIGSELTEKDIERLDFDWDEFKN